MLADFCQLGGTAQAGSKDELDSLESHASWIVFLQ
jgi:hypothetical protein